MAAPIPPTPSRSRTRYRNAAVADGRSDHLELNVTVVVEDGRIQSIRPADADADRRAEEGLEIVDASGATIVPGMVDAHSHVTLPGGAEWIERIGDPPEQLLLVAEHNGALLTSSGVRWARDVGAPYVEDPTDGRSRALSIGVRERWRGRADRPYLRVAGTWLDKKGTLPSSVGTVEAEDARELLANAVGQLDDGVDLLKLYLDGPEEGRSPWTASELEPVTQAAHARGVRVTAHATNLDGARQGVAGGVDSIEHGEELDADLAREMAERGTFLVSTLSVFRSWKSFARTTSMERFTDPARVERLAARLERVEESVRTARKAGVRIAAGTDFGGGSTRANQLAWEVESLVASGLEPWEALGAATWRGGELLGEPGAGVIAEGGLADFFLVHGDPLSDPAALWRVWRVAWET